MTRFLSTAGVAVYVLALSTAFPSVHDAVSGLGGLVPAAVAAEADAGQVSTAERDADENLEALPRVAETAGWNQDRDGMLMDEAAATDPMTVLSAL